MKRIFSFSKFNKLLKINSIKISRQKLNQSNSYIYGFASIGLGFCLLKIADKTIKCDENLNHQQIYIDQTILNGKQNQIKRNPESMPQKSQTDNNIERQNEQKQKSIQPSQQINKQLSQSIQSASKIIQFLSTTIQSAQPIKGQNIQTQSQQIKEKQNIDLTLKQTIENQQIIQANQDIHNQIKLEISKSLIDQEYSYSINQILQDNQNKSKQISTSHQNLQFEKGPMKALIIIPQNKLLEQDGRRIQQFLKFRGVQITRNIQKSSSPHIKIQVCNLNSTCKNIDFTPNSDHLHHINNLLSPMLIINSITQATSLLQNTIHSSQYLISTYIPSQNKAQSYSHYDTFSSRYKKLPIEQLQRNFQELKYLSSSKKHQYVIVKNEQTAKFLKINIKNQGAPNLLIKYDPNNKRDVEPNCKINQHYYRNINNFNTIQTKQQTHHQWVQQTAFKINLLTQNNVQLINYKQDLYDKIRKLQQLKRGYRFSLQQSKSYQQHNQINKQNNALNKQNNFIDKQHNSIDKKLFIIKIDDPKLEIQNQIDKIIQKVAKLNQNHVSIVKTHNQALFKSDMLRIIKDQYGTVRLVDVNSIQKQKSINHTHSQTDFNNFFKRYIHKNSFQIQNLSRFIDNCSKNLCQQYYEHEKGLTILRNSYPGDFQPYVKSGAFQPEIKSNNKPKLVLFYKQSCQGCHMMQSLLRQLSTLQQKLISSTISAQLKREICLKYRITSPQTFSKLIISKYNILNEDQHIQVPQITPTLILFDKNNVKKQIIKTQGLFNKLDGLAKKANQQMVRLDMIRDLLEQYENANIKLHNLI